jgi:hypothetical protein
MTYEEALAEIDARIAKAIDHGMELLVSKGASLAEAESYVKQLATEREAAIAKLKVVTEGWIARDDAPLN